jgi:cell division protein FtsB
MSHVSCIFTLKPIVDLLHADASIYVTEINTLKERIAELEKENAELRVIISTPIKEEKPRSKPRIAPPILVVDDTAFAKEAETYEEPVNTVVENTEKVVVLHEEKSRKEYQQEYQRNYRKLKKEKQLSINNKE